MTKMKMDELNNKSKDELTNLSGDLKAKLLKLNFDLADNKVKDVSQVKKVKKDIARIMTAINNKFSSEGGSASGGK